MPCDDGDAIMRVGVLSERKGWMTSFCLGRAPPIARMRGREDDKDENNELFRRDLDHDWTDAEGVRWRGSSQKLWQAAIMCGCLIRLCSMFFQLTSEFSLDEETNLLQVSRCCCAFLIFSCWGLSVQRRCWVATVLKEVAQELSSTFSPPQRLFSLLPYRVTTIIDPNLFRQ